ncbi:Succinoglycan biosynthesis transport protein [Halorhabdus tiamatea SARL4B]|uniref:Succinoglycan biosynthesis transport protein n=1 Tax=Halorhabdus tiamatea SARL4B TaxID=1033806 RepID=F7PJ20_9EURY|nr:oligosaccharide flippase family protein [Halorhabdus tiamatea]ERJ06877.1 Succinoglycan biosynthesis transport protein [Halorhabdus tiamatea SARL4B]CCQ32985.1 succinoglycan biosynthesis transport protein [Halorhabdus tiamatea SARL4B]
MSESDPEIPDDEREALVTIVHGAVVTSGGVSIQRALSTGTEFVLARGLDPVVYGVYALAWRIAGLLVRLVTFGSVPTLQRYLPSSADQPATQSRVTGLAYATTAGFGLAIAVQNGLQVLLLRRFEGLWPFDATFLPPLVAGGVSLTVMVGVRTLGDGLAVAALGSLLGIGAYVGALAGLGVDPRDRLVASELAGRYREALGERLSR